MQGALYLIILALTAGAFVGLARAPRAKNPFVGLLVSTILMGISVALLICADFI